MPLYNFEKLDNPEIKESFFFTMSECPRVSEVITDDDGVQWKRIFSLPYAGIDTKIDHNSERDFVEKTGKKRGTYGDMLDAASEASQKRAKERDGIDPVQKKFFSDYQRKRHGVKHLQELKKTKIDKKDFSISYE